MPAKKNWVGYRFNTFEVIEEDKDWKNSCEQKIREGKIKRYNNKYLCRCSCGNVISVSAVQIAKNRPLSCGCVPIRNGENLVGRAFGDWKVLERDIEKELSLKVAGKTFHDYWKCQCVCGKIVSVLGSHLRDGTSTNCGCLKSQKISIAKTLDLTGKVFGKLTVIKKTGKKSKDGNYWLCQCECGNFIEVSVYSLTSGKISECNHCRANGFSSVKSYSTYKRAQEKIGKVGSLGDRLKSKYKNLDLDIIWSDKNKLSPFQLTPKSHQQIYLICPECKTEFITSGLQLYERTYDIMCPDCLSKLKDSIYEKAVKNFLNNELNLKTLHENSCNLKPINPKTGARLFYDNEVPSCRIIIEVHGQQHYDIINYSSWLSDKTPEDWLNDLQWRDEYKKQYAIKNGYKYIVLSYEQILNGSYKEIIKSLLKEGETNEI